MGAKHFLPRFSKYHGTNPDIGSNTLQVRASSAYPIGTSVTARWGDIYATSTNLTGNLLIGQGSLSTDGTSTASQITFGDDFYIAQTSATHLKIGTGIDSSSSTVMKITSSGVVVTGTLAGTSIASGSSVSAATTLHGTQFKPTSADFLLYEGTPDDHETTMTITDPTADRTITFPDASGTVAFTSGVGVTSLSGTTANGITTYASTGTLDVESNLIYSEASPLSILQMKSVQDTGDTFSIITTTHGATTISTADDDANAANLTLSVDGNFNVDAVGDIRLDAGSKQFYFDYAGTNLIHFDINASDYRIKSNINQNDYFNINVAAEGATTLSTVDADTSVAHLTIQADGEVNVTSTENKINKTYDFHGTTFETTYSDDQASGTVIKYSPGSSSSLNGSEIYYLRTNGVWIQAEATTAAGMSLLGVGLGGDPQTVGVLLKGFVRVASTEILNKPTNVPGMLLYMSTTAGHFDFTAPSGNGDVVRIVGYAIDEDGGDVLVYFDPDKTYVEITA